MLSFVDFYRPSYFLLENVDALLYAKLQAEQNGAKQVGGIHNGMIKFILRTLTALGYDLQYHTLVDLANPIQISSSFQGSTSWTVWLSTKPATCHILGCQKDIATATIPNTNSLHS